MLMIHFEDDPVQAVVRFRDRSMRVFGVESIEQKVLLGPNPTWPTPEEFDDMIADAVRNVLDVAQQYAGYEVGRAKPDDVTINKSNGVWKAGS